jgi:hypothetical protein
MGLGFYFMWLYYRFNKRLVGKHERKKNYVTLGMIINELVFSVIPSSMYVLFDILGIPFGAMFGPLMTLAHAVKKDRGVKSKGSRLMWLPRRRSFGVRG